MIYHARFLSSPPSHPSPVAFLQACLPSLDPALLVTFILHVLCIPLHSVPADGLAADTCIFRRCDVAITLALFPTPTVLCVGFFDTRVTSRLV
jgi:hypothetical protein